LKAGCRYVVDGLEFDLIPRTFRAKHLLHLPTGNRATVFG
jgi:hypothetical protein